MLKALLKFARGLCRKVPVTDDQPTEPLDGKEHIKKIRERQKVMVSTKAAVLSFKNWTVGDSRREGKKMINARSELPIVSLLDFDSHSEIRL